ncbi:hypothetical protein [Streptomyces sp. NPDC001226]
MDRVMKWLAVVAGLAIMQSGPQTELSCGKLAPMDTAKLELAAQRYREAETALDAARADLQAEVVVFLRQTERAWCPGRHRPHYRMDGRASASADEER